MRATFSPSRCTHVSPRRPSSSDENEIMSLMSCDFMRRAGRWRVGIVWPTVIIMFWFDWKISTKMRCCHQSSRLNGSDICQANGKRWDHCELLFFGIRNSAINLFLSLSVVSFFKCQKNNDKCPYKSLLVLSSSCSCRLKLESIYNNNTELSTE